MKENIIQILNNQLSQFGLKPSDWEIQPEKHNQMVIRHRFEKEFELKGLVQSKEGRYKWEKIELFKI